MRAVDPYHPGTQGGSNAATDTVTSCSVREYHCLQEGRIYNRRRPQLFNCGRKRSRDRGACGSSIVRYFHGRPPSSQPDQLIEGLRGGSVSSQPGRSARMSRCPLRPGRARSHQLTSNGSPGELRPRVMALLENPRDSRPRLKTSRCFVSFEI